MSEQGTAEWFEERCGNVTASRIADVINFKRNGDPSEARRRYMAEIIAERLTGETYEHFVSKPMQWGIDNEPYARAAYEARTGTFVDVVGYVPHPFIERAGASPDGLVDEHGSIEIKCPMTANHIQTLISGTADPQYMPQMQWQMGCDGRAWCDFASFDPRLPEPMDLFIARVDRDPEYIAWLEDAVREFLREADEMIERLKGAA